MKYLLLFPSVLCEFLNAVLNWLPIKDYRYIRAAAPWRLFRIDQLAIDYWQSFAIFICVIVFILSGFEHCIANMYYISLAKLWSLKAVLSMLIMILGNSVGSIFIAIFNNKIKEN